MSVCTQGEGWPGAKSSSPLTVVLGVTSKTDYNAADWAIQQQITAEAGERRNDYVRVRRRITLGGSSDTKFT